MSLLQKASIITTPTAYAEDYLYSIKPAYQVSDTELVTNGTFDTDSNWTKGTGWTISGGKAVKVAGTGSILSQSNVVEVGKRYKLTFDVIRTAGYIDSIFMGGVSDGTNIEESGSYTYYIKSVNLGALGFNANSSFAGSIDNVSVKEITDADFDFDRNSTGTRVNEDYLIEDVPYNLVDYSQDFTNSSWTKNNASVTSDNTISPDGAGGCSLYTLNSYTGDNQFLRINPNTTFASGLAHSYSLFVKYNSFQYVKLAFINYGTSQYFAAIFDIINGIVTDTKNISASNTNASIESAGNGWYRIKITASLTSSAGNAMNYEFNKSTGATPTYGTYGRISQTTTTSDKVFIWGGQLVKGDQPKEYLKTTDRLDIPRIDYTNGEPSILLEPSRTNSITYSNDFTQSPWSGTQGLTLTANNAVSPEGITNATKLEVDGSNSNPALGSNGSITIGQTYTLSIFVKNINFNGFVRLAHFSSSQTGAWFDLDKGEIKTVNSTSATIDKFPNGWYKLTNTFVALQSTNTLLAMLGFSDSDGSVTSTVTGQSVLAYGAQLELGSYATSLIHTSGSAVTRSADAANNAGNSDLINSTEGVLYAEIKANSNDETGRQITISDGSTQNNIQIKYTAIDNRIDGIVKSGNVQQASFNHTFSTVLEYHKVAVKYKANDCAFYVDGVQIATDSIATMPVGLKKLAFDNGGGSNDFLGNCKMVAVFKEALTDLELEKLTGYNNHELYLNYYNRLSYLGLVEEYNVESDINNYIL